jgi:peroxiredoxin
VLVAVAPTVLGADYRPQIGEPHNDFVLPRTDTREPIALSQFRGKKVLLIHFASW